MKLTKEGCINALRYLGDYNGEEYNCHKFANAMEDLYQLIEEHFASSETRVETRENQPLKFEELKPDMWVWDNVPKIYMKIYDISYSERCFNVNGEWYLNDLYLEEFDFEENRFYRREVKDEV